MRVDPAAPDQPTVLDLRQQDFTALDNRKGTILQYLIGVPWGGV